MEPERRSRMQVGAAVGSARRCSGGRMAWHGGPWLRGSVAAKAGRGEGRGQWLVLKCEVIAPGVGFRGVRPHWKGLCLRGSTPPLPHREVVTEAQPFSYFPSCGFFFIDHDASIRCVRPSALQTHTNLDVPRRRAVPCSRAVSAAESTPAAGSGAERGREAFSTWAVSLFHPGDFSFFSLEGPASSRRCENRRLRFGARTWMDGSRVTFGRKQRPNRECLAVPGGRSDMAPLCDCHANCLT